jgi:tetraacyldisaccharide-1-P 4'-kinase
MEIMRFTGQIANGWIIWKTSNIWAHLTTVMKQCKRPKNTIQKLMVVITVVGNVTPNKF